MLLSLQDEVDAAVQQLLALKLEYKNVMGKDYQPPAGAGRGGGKKDKQNKEKKEKGGKEKGKEQKKQQQVGMGML